MVKERGISHEVEMQVFWSYFQKFCQGNQQEIDEVRARVERFRLNGEPLGQIMINRAVQGYMLFCFGATMVMEKAKRITAGLKLPERRLAGSNEFDFGIFALNRCRGFLGSPDKYWFDLKLDCLIWPNESLSLLKSWKEDQTKTVSIYLTDRQVIEMVLGGVEECAHFLYVKNKGGIYVRDTKEMVERREQFYEHLAKMKEYDLANAIYHTSDVEYRGLIWRSWFLKEFFPSFAGDDVLLKEKVMVARKTLAESLAVA